MTVLVVLVKVTLVLAAAALYQWRFGARLSAAARHLVWTLAIAGVTLLPALTIVLPEWRTVQYTAPAGASPVFQAVMPVSPPPVGVVAQAAPAAQHIPWMRLLWTVYLGGVVLLLVRLTLQHLHTARLVRAAAPIAGARWLALLQDSQTRLGIRRLVQLRCAADDVMPMAAGVRRAAILLPAQADTWSDDRRRAVLLHELAHVGRHDCLTQTLAAVACALYWPHPGVWWVAGRLRAERELACDDRVLSVGEDARDYAGHLLELAHTLARDTAPAV